MTRNRRPRATVLTGAHKTYSFRYFRNRITNSGRRVAITSHAIFVLRIRQRKRLFFHQKSLNALDR